MQQVFSVTQVNEYIRSRMEEDPVLTQVAVRGEISNYKLYPSGHHYFTIKDESSALRCVLFKGNAFRLRFRPENGMRVIVLGRISVFPRDGAYQLYCTSLTVDGIGDLYVAFEQLKAKLAAQGLFDQEHKKPLPQYPNVIGIITSSAGAAVHDMLRILNKRYPIAKVKLLPVRVQGMEAPGEIVAAIRYANQYKLADLLIVGRGGGSIEDLWAFNDEQVAYAIYNSEIPVVSAVGHEPDVTISDFVADLRAATPSNAAELAVPDRENLMQHLDSMENTMAVILQRQIREYSTQLEALSNSPVLKSPTGYLNQKKRELELMTKRLISVENQITAAANKRYIGAVAKLDAMSPLKVLSRGYSIVEKSDGTLLRSIMQIAQGEAVSIHIPDGVVSAEITQVRRNEHEKAE